MNVKVYRTKYLLTVFKESTYFHLEAEEGLNI